MTKDTKNNHTDYKNSWVYGQMRKGERKSNGGSNNSGCNGDGSYTNKGF